MEREIAKSTLGRMDTILAALGAFVARVKAEVEAESLAQPREVALVRCVNGHLWVAEKIHRDESWTVAPNRCPDCGGLYLYEERIQAEEIKNWPGEAATVPVFSWKP